MSLCIQLLPKKYVFACMQFWLDRIARIRDGQMTTDRCCCCQMLLISSVYSFPAERQRLKNMTRRKFKFKSSRIQAESSALNVRERESLLVLLILWVSHTPHDPKPLVSAPLMILSLLQDDMNISHGTSPTSIQSPSLSS